MAGNKNSGRQKNPPKARDLLKEVIPTQDMFDEEELPIYESLIDIYLKDFDEDDLTSSDIDDLMTLATNKIMEIRILKDSKGSPSKQLDIANAIEKLRKQSDKIKENLSSRRKDRIDPHAYDGFSIVDLAVSFDNSKKLVLEEKARKLKEEQDSILNDLDNYGNKNDIDSISNKS